MPSYGFFLRHVTGIDLSHIKLDYAQPEARPAFVLNDVDTISIDHLDAQKGTGPAALFDLRQVRDFSVAASRGIADTLRTGSVDQEKL